MLRKQMLKGLIFVLLIALIQSACSLNQSRVVASTDTPLPTRISTMTASQTNVPPSATLTATPTLTSSPTATLTPAPTLTSIQATTVSPSVSSAPLGIRVFVSANSTTTSIKGSVDNGRRVTYLLKADADQVIMVAVKSANPGLILDIHSPTGDILLDPSAHESYWQGALPATGDYVIVVNATDGFADYVLDITIPVRVHFKPGAISALVDGFVPARGVTTYLLQGEKNKTMTVTVNSPRGNVALAIYGLEDGQSFVRSDSAQTVFRFQLSASQDYVIQCVSAADIAENYQIEFIVR